MREFTVGQTTRLYAGDRFRLGVLHCLCAEVCTEVYNDALQKDTRDGLCSLVRTYTKRQYPNSSIDFVILADMKMWLGEQNVSWGSKMSVTLPYVCSVDGKNMRLALLKLAAEHYTCLRLGHRHSVLKVQRPLSETQMCFDPAATSLAQVLKRTNMPQRLVPFLRELKRTKLHPIDRID